MSTFLRIGFKRSNGNHWHGKLVRDNGEWYVFNGDVAYSNWQRFQLGYGITANDRYLMFRPISSFKDFLSDEAEDAFFWKGDTAPFLPMTLRSMYIHAVSLSPNVVHRYFDLRYPQEYYVRGGLGNEEYHMRYDLIDASRPEEVRSNTYSISNYSVDVSIPALFPVVLEHTRTHSFSREELTTGQSSINVYEHFNMRGFINQFDEGSFSKLWLRALIECQQFSHVSSYLANDFGIRTWERRQPRLVISIHPENGTLTVMDEQPAETEVDWSRLTVLAGNSYGNLVINSGRSTTTSTLRSVRFDEDLVSYMGEQPKDNRPLATRSGKFMEATDVRLLNHYCQCAE